MKQLNEEFIYELGRTVTKKDKKVKYYIFISQSLGEEIIVSDNRIDAIEKSFKNDISKQKYIKNLRKVNEILRKYNFTPIEHTNPPVWGFCVDKISSKKMGLDNKTKNIPTSYRYRLVNCLKELRQYESIPPIFSDNYTPKMREEEADNNIVNMLYILKNTIKDEKESEKTGKKFKPDERIQNLVDAKESFNKCKKEIESELLEKLKNNDAHSYIANLMRYKGRLKIDDFRGHELSALNKLLVLKQFPDAILVKSRDEWRELNRDIVPNAQPIYLISPENIEPDAETKSKIKQNTLQNFGKNEHEFLTHGEKRIMKVNQSNDQKEFKANPKYKHYAAFDYSQTEQIRGKRVIIDDSDFYTKQELNPQHNGKVSSSFYLIISLASFLDNIGIEFKLKEAIDKRMKALAYMNDGKITMGKTFINANADTLSVFLHETAHAIMHNGNLANRREDAKNLYKPSSNKKIKEQEAELVSWSVMKYFGFNMDKSLIYTLSYGLNEKNVLSILDHVSDTANYIVLGIKKYYNPYRNNSSNNMKNASLILDKFGLLDYMSDEPNEEQEMVTTGNNNNGNTQTETGKLKESILREGAIFTIDNLASALGITKLVQQAKKDKMNNNNSEEVVENNKKQFYENYKRFFGKRVDL